MQHDTLTEEVCSALLNEVEQAGAQPAQGGSRPTIPPPAPRARRFNDHERRAILPFVVVASSARCPVDDAWLVTTVDPDVIALRCPQCGATAEWRAPVGG